MRKIFDGITVKIFSNEAKSLNVWRFITYSHGKFLNGEYTLRRA